MAQADTAKKDPEFDLQNFNSGSLLAVGLTELKSYNSIYTQRREFGTNLFDTRDNFNNSRTNFFTSAFSFYHGITNRVNVGFDINLRAFSRSNFESSPFEVLRFKNDGPDARVALASGGVKVKYVPFAKVPNLVFQHAVWVPLSKELEDRRNGFTRFTDFDRIQIWNSIFYTIDINSNYQLFLGTEFVPRLDAYGDQSSDLINFNKAFFSYFAKDYLTLFAMAEAAPTIKLQENGFSGFYAQTGGGFKYVADGFIAEFMYTHFVAGSEFTGFGSTYNLGFSKILK